MSKITNHNWYLITQSENCIVYENPAKSIIRIYTNHKKIKLIALDSFKYKIDKTENYNY